MTRALAALAALAASLTAHAGTVPPGVLVVDVELDTRRCVSPLCGGFWVDEVNQRGTVCADGATAAQCYVAEIDWSALTARPRTIARLTQHIADGDLLIAGHLELRPYPGFGDLGVFVVEKVWVDPTAL